MPLIKGEAVIVLKDCPPPPVLTSEDASTVEKLIQRTALPNPAQIYTTFIRINLCLLSPDLKRIIPFKLVSIHFSSQQHPQACREQSLPSQPQVPSAHQDQV